MLSVKLSVGKQKPFCSCQTMEPFAAKSVPWELSASPC